MTPAPVIPIPLSPDLAIPSDTPRRFHLPPRGDMP